MAPRQWSRISNWSSSNCGASASGHRPSAAPSCSPVRAAARGAGGERDRRRTRRQSQADGTVVTSFTRKKPVRAPFPEHLPRERVVIPAPAACPCCGGKLAKLGEDVTETLEVVPRQWKVVQTVREKFTCRSCEKITQPPAPFHTIACGRAGASLLAMILYGRYGHHQPLKHTTRLNAIARRSDLPIA
jgi:transposase